MDTLIFDLAPDERDIFLADVDEHLRAMESGILRLEHGADREIIGTIFRAAHTLKALAGTIGHRRMADLTHVIETLFEALRDGRVLLTPSAADDLLTALDMLAMLRGEIVTGVPSSADVDALCSRIAALLQRDGVAGVVLSGAPAQAPASHDSDKIVRISVERLDTLMDLVGELVTDRTRLAQLAATLCEQAVDAESSSALNELTAHLSRVVGQLQEEVMRARMLPIAGLFDKFPRQVRDLARGAGKQVELYISGAGTKLDRSIIEGLHDPLIHLVRNAIDHGIEPPEERIRSGKSRVGTVQLGATQEDGHIVITVADDGRGIDPQQVAHAAVVRGLIAEADAAQLDDEARIDMIFWPRLSTAEQVTQLSGRGIGMDAVRAQVERLNGVIELESQVGKGTTFRLTIPLTLTIVSTMLVALGESIFAIPMASIIDMLAFQEQGINTVRGYPAILRHDTVLPLFDLRQIFAQPQITAAPRSAKPAIVTVGWGKLRIGLIVDRIIGQQEVVVKALSPLIGSVPGISGSATLGDGRIALTIDIPSMLKRAMHDRKPGGASDSIYTLADAARRATAGPGTA